MKYLVNIFFSLILAFGLYGQGYQIITTVDTLQSGDVIITQTDINGNIIDKGLAKPGFAFENDTTEISYTPPLPPDNSGDVFVDNIDMPNIDGGFLPQDIVFNPHNGNYYIYGYRKVLVCDADMNVIKTLEISNLDNFSGFYSDYHQRMICVHPSQNKVYCLTLEGVLLEIDQYYNVIELTDPISNIFIQRASMLYCDVDNSIWYYILMIDENSNSKTQIKRYSSNGTLQSVGLDDQIAYDLDYIFVTDSYRVYVSTNEGIEVYDAALNYVSTIGNDLAYDHIETINNLLFSHIQNDDKLEVRTVGGSLFCYVSNLTMNKIRFLLADPIINKLYVSAYNSLTSGIHIIGLNQPVYSIISSITGYNAIFGLADNTTYTIASGKADVIYINKSDESISVQSCNSLGHIYRIAANTIQDIKACAIQPLNGNAIFFVPSQTGILDIGGQVSALCVKDDKVFAAVHKYNQDGYILVLNASSGKIIDKIQPNFDFNPVDIFCSNDPAVDNDRVYVVYFDMDDQTTISRLMFFDNESYQITQPTPPVYFDGGSLEYLITPNGTICFGVRTGDLCPAMSYVYFYDYNLIEKSQAHPAEFGCIEEFDYFEIEFMQEIRKYFVWVSRCNHRIYFFADDEEDTTLEYTHFTGQNNPPPITFAYNEHNGLCYFFDGDEELYTIVPVDYSVSYHENVTLSEQKACEMYFNPNDNKIYAFTEEALYKIVNLSTPPERYELPEIYIYSEEEKLENDYIYSSETDTLYLPTIIHNGYRKKSLLITYNPTQSFSTIESKQLILYNGKVNANKFQGIGKHLTYFLDKKILFEANSQFSNTGILTTHNESRTLTGNWDWISFPRMPRLGNEGYDSQTLLETIEELDDLTLITSGATGLLEQIYQFSTWISTEIPELYSTVGYKYYSDPSSSQTLAVTGVVIDPPTPIPLSSQYENWIGYFLEYSLSPDEAFIGIWDKLTRITTKDWTIILDNGIVIKRTYNETPLSYGDGLIVEVDEDCDLVWNTEAEAEEDFELQQTENFSFNEQAEYTPFYFEMDSTTGIQEIGLTVNDSCVGAAVVGPCDSIVEVNAYLIGTPSGVPIEVETWDGFKSAGFGTTNYSVVDPYTNKRISRKVYTGENQPFYVLSFKAGERAEEEDVVVLQPPAPNPFNNSCSLSFVLKRYAGVLLTVHDLRGKPVATLLQGAYPEGLYEAAWTGKDASGNQMDNGIYMIRMNVEDMYMKNEKVVLIR